MNNRNSSHSLGEIVYQALCEDLSNGKYRPGDRLREDEIAQQLKVSRTPVREAFGRLLNRRLVEPGGGRGLIVRSLDMAEILELYAMREILEGAVARLAAQYATPSEIEALSDLEDSFNVHVDDCRDLTRINARFHKTIVTAARNRYLDRALQELQDSIVLLGATTFSAPGRPITATEEHHAIVMAIEIRDPDRAEQAARHHIRESLRIRLRLLGE